MANTGVFVEKFLSIKTFYNRYQLLSLAFAGTIYGKEVLSYCEDDCRSESDSSKWSTQFLERVVQELEVRAVEDSTLATYMVAWHGFCDFYIHLDDKEITWEHRLELYVAYLIIKKAQEATIKSYISGIKYVANLIGIHIDDSKCRFHSLVKAARIKNGKIRIRLPIKLKLLNRMIDELPNIPKLQNQPYLVKLYRAIFASAYYGLLRIGEITGSKHSISSRDVHLAMDRPKVQFRIWTAKNKKRGAWPDDIKIEGLRDCKACFKDSQVRSSYRYCPVHLIMQYHSVRPQTPGNVQFFCFQDGRPIPQVQLRNIIKLVLKSMGITTDAHNGQSFRSGRACDLKKLNYSIRDIKFFGRWKGNSIYKYFK